MVCIRGMVVVRKQEAKRMKLLGFCLIGKSHPLRKKVNCHWWSLCVTGHVIKCILNKKYLIYVSVLPCVICLARACGPLLGPLMINDKAVLASAHLFGDSTVLDTQSRQISYAGTITFSEN